MSEAPEERVEEAADANASEAEQWQRLAPLALVFLVISGLQKFIRENLFVFAGAGAGAAFLDWFGLRELLLGGLAILLTLIVGSIIYHRRFRFRLEPDAVRVRRGIFEQKELRVRFARVQNIQLGRPFYFRPFGLVRFSLETPGATEKEVSLPGISVDLAERMRDRITGSRGADPEQAVDAGEVDEPPALYAASTGRLFVYGMSSNQVWVIAGVLGSLYGTVLRRFEVNLEDSEAVQWLAENIDSPVLAVSGMFILVLVALVLLSGVLAVVRYHGFCMRERDDRVVSVGGLLEQREQTLRLEKITGITLKQSALGRLVGTWGLLVRQAQSGEAELSGKEPDFVAPGLRRNDHAIAGHLLPSARVPERFEPVNDGFRRLLWVRLFIVMVIALLALGMLLGWQHWSLLPVAVGLSLAIAGAHLRWRHWGWWLDGRQLWVRQGLLGQSLDTFDLERVQQARVSESPYQRRNKLASLELVLPQGTVTIPFLPMDQAAELANRALRAAETAREHRV